MTGNESPTDIQLVSLFSVLGYDDIYVKQKELFFSNLALGYRNQGFSGGFNRKWLKDDAGYTKELINIIEPEVVLCLGKVTYEEIASSFFPRNVRVKRFYETLAQKKNYCDVVTDNGKKVRLFALAHCGSYGTMNRKKYSKDKESGIDGMEQMKNDWKEVRRYLNKL